MLRHEDKIKEYNLNAQFIDTLSNMEEAILAVEEVDPVLARNILGVGKSENISIVNWVFDNIKSIEDSDKNIFEGFTDREKFICATGTLMASLAADLNEAY